MTAWPDLAIGLALGVAGSAVWQAIQNRHRAVAGYRRHKAKRRNENAIFGLTLRFACPDDWDAFKRKSNDAFRNLYGAERSERHVDVISSDHTTHAFKAGAWQFAWKILPDGSLMFSVPDQPSGVNSVTSELRRFLGILGELSKNPHALGEFHHGKLRLDLPYARFRVHVPGPRGFKITDYSIHLAQSSPDCRVELSFDGKMNLTSSNQEGLISLLEKAI